METSFRVFRVTALAFATFTLIAFAGTYPCAAITVDATSLLDLARDEAQPTVWAKGFGPVSGWPIKTTVRTLADVDGDGRLDAVGFADKGVWVARSTGAAFETPSIWLSSFGVAHGYGEAIRQMADVDGDGRDDIVAFGPYGVVVARSLGDTFGPPRMASYAFGSDPIAGGWDPALHPCTLADVDGDGRMDVVGFGPTGILVALSKGTTFGPPHPWWPGFGLDAGWQAPEAVRLLGDIDGGGADVVGISPWGVLVAHSTGRSFGPARFALLDFGTHPDAGGYAATSDLRALADLDGDGHMDLVGVRASGVWVALSAGGLFGPASAWSPDFGADGLRLLGDIDGDGRDDIVGFAFNGTYQALSNGTALGPRTFRGTYFGAYAEAGAWSTSKTVRLLGDVDGDGTDDIVGFSGDAVWVSSSRLFALTVDEVAPCYAPLDLDASDNLGPTVPGDSPPVELDALLAAAEQTKAACQAVCADTYPLVTQLDLCHDTAFWSTACGLIEKDRMTAAKAAQNAGETGLGLSTCFDVGYAYQASSQFLDTGTVKTVVKPDTIAASDPATVLPGGQHVDAVHFGYDHSGQKFEGLSTHYFGWVMQAATANTADPDGNALMFGLTRGLMDGDGARVKTCTEYVYEKYYELSKYLDAIGFFIGDDTQAWNVAYAPYAIEWVDAGGTMVPVLVLPDTAIGTRALEGTPPASITGEPIPSVFEGQTRQKNAFFEVPVVSDADRPEVLAAYDAGYNLEQALNVCLFDIGLGKPCPWIGVALQSDVLHGILTDGRANHTYAETWQWHRDMGDALLADHLQEELDSMQEWEERFLFLLYRRQQLVSEFEERLRALYNQLKALGQIAEQPPLPDVLSPIDPISQNLAAQSDLRTSYMVNALLDAALAKPTDPGFLGGYDELFGSAMGGGAGMSNPGDTMLSGVPPDTLLAYTSSAIAAPNSAVAAKTAPPTSTLPAADLLYGDLHERIVQVNALVEAELQKAYDAGCLDLSGPTVCDWSPKLFVQRLQDHLEQLSEIDYQWCLDNFDDPEIYALYQNGEPLSFQGGFPTIGVDVGGSVYEVPCDPTQIPALLPGDAAWWGEPSDIGDWAASYKLLELFPRCQYAFVGYVVEQLAAALGGKDNVIEGPLPTTPGGSGGGAAAGATTVRLQQTEGDSVLIGSDDFGIEMGYAVSWKTPNFRSAPGANCDINPAVSANTFINGKVFGSGISLFDAGADAGVVDVNGTRHFQAGANITLFGIDILSGWDYDASLADIDYHVILEDDQRKEWKHTLVTLVVTVGPVPLSLKAGIAGRVGVRYLLAGGIPATQNCDQGFLRVHGEFTPYAGVDAFVSASVDLLVVEAGIEAALTLIELSFPFHVDLDMKVLPEDVGQPATLGDPTTLDLSAGLDMRITLLSGVLRAFVEVCYIIDCSRFDVTLFEWDGPSHTTNLFEASALIDLGPVRWLQQFFDGT